MYEYPFFVSRRHFFESERNRECKRERARKVVFLDWEKELKRNKWEGKRKQKKVKEKSERERQRKI